MKINRSLLLYTIIYNVVYGLLFLYVPTNVAGVTGGKELLVFPFFWSVGVNGFIMVGLRNMAAFQYWVNWLLALFCTPIPTFVLVNLFFSPFW